MEECHVETQNAHPLSCPLAPGAGVIWGRASPSQHQDLPSPPGAIPL